MSSRATKISTRTLRSKEVSALHGLQEALFREFSHGAELFITLLDELLDGDSFQISYLGLQRSGQSDRHRCVVVVRATFRFGDDLVDQLEALQVLGRDSERRRRLRGVVLVAP